MVTMTVFTLLLLLLTYFRPSQMQNVDIGLHLINFFGSNFLEGNHLTLLCTTNTHFSSYSVIENITLSFIKDGRILTSDDVFIDEEFEGRSIPPSLTFFGVSNVELSFQVTREDVGYYECCAFDGDPRENNRLDCDGTRVADVKYAPVPTCVPSVEARVHLGDQVTLSCASEGGNIPVDIKWTNENVINSTALSSEVITRENVYNVTSKLTLSTSDTDVNDVYMCEASYDGYRFLTRICTISVQAIWPTLSVQPNEVGLVADQNEHATFTCDFQYLTGYNTTFKWSSVPPINQSRISSAHNVFTISDVDMSDNDTFISCLGLFQDRWLEATARLFVSKSAYGDGITFQQPPVIIDNTAFTMTGQRSSGSEGWAAAFSVVFIAMVTVIGVVIFMYLKFWRISKPSPSADFPMTSVIADNKGQKTDLADDRTYMDLKSSTPDDDAASKEDAAKDDVVYEGVGNTGESHQNAADDALYQYTFDVKD